MAYRNLEERPKLAFYEQGPGPAFYSIPVLIGRRNHAPTHRINPEYSFGLKLRSAFIPYSVGPGPAYLIPYGLKANGYFIGYHYSFRRRFPFGTNNTYKSKSDLLIEAVLIDLISVCLQPSSLSAHPHTLCLLQMSTDPELQLSLLEVEQQSTISEWLQLPILTCCLPWLDLKWSRELLLPNAHCKLHHYTIILELYHPCN